MMSSTNLKIDELFIKKIRKTFFEYYKQGFLFGNFIINGGLAPSRVELKNLILEDFNVFFETNQEEHFTKLKNDSKVMSSTELSLSDIIADPEEIREITHPLGNTILTTCPSCGKVIRAQDIDIEKIDISKINNFPFDYIHIHSNVDSPPHALLMYFDANFKVRGRKVPKFTNLKQK